MPSCLPWATRTPHWDWALTPPPPTTCLNVNIQSWLLLSCVTLGKLLSLSVPQLLTCKMHCYPLIGWLCTLTESTRSVEPVRTLHMCRHRWYPLPTQPGRCSADSRVISGTPTPKGACCLWDSLSFHDSAFAPVSWAAVPTAGHIGMKQGPLRGPGSGSVDLQWALLGAPSLEVARARVSVPQKPQGGSSAPYARACRGRAGVGCLPPCTTWGSAPALTLSAPQPPLIFPCPLPLQPHKHFSDRWGWELT